MPEGHTIHRLATDLARDLRGRPIVASSPQGRFAESAARIDGGVVERTEAFGKQLFVDFTDGTVLSVHLGLIGKFRRWPAGRSPSASARLRLRPADGGEHVWELTGPMVCELIDPQRRERVAAAIGPDPLRRNGSVDEFVRRAIEQDGAHYHRGRVSKITQEDGRLIVRGVDTLAGEPLTIVADLVVLASAMRPAAGVEELAQKVNVGYDEFGFLCESHPKLRPVETNAAGVFVCGACHGPKDIPESVAQASAAAGKVLLMFSRDQLHREPEIAHIQESHCAGCFACRRGCPYHAIDAAEIRDRQGLLVRRVARVNPGLCMGCGTCVALCPSKSADLEGFSEQQVYAMVECLR